MLYFLCPLCAAVTYLCMMVRPVHFLFLDVRASVISQVVGVLLMVCSLTHVRVQEVHVCMCVLLQMITGGEMHYGPAGHSIIPVICLNTGSQGSTIKNSTFHQRLLEVHSTQNLFTWWSRACVDEHNILHLDVRTALRNNRRRLIYVHLCSTACFLWLLSHLPQWTSTWKLQNFPECSALCVVEDWWIVWNCKHLRWKNTYLHANILQQQIYSTQWAMKRNGR